MMTGCNLISRPYILDKAEVTSQLEKRRYDSHNRGFSMTAVIPVLVITRSILTSILSVIGGDHYKNSDVYEHGWWKVE
jgi:hypothetical protein